MTLSYANGPSTLPLRGETIGQALRDANRDFWPEQHRNPKAFSGSRFPSIAPLAAPGALLFRKNNDAFRRTIFRHLPLPRHW